MRLWKRREELDLLEHEFFIPAAPLYDQPPGEHVIDDGEVLEFVSMTRIEDGADVLPVFTSEDGLRAWDPDLSGCIALAGSDMLATLLDNEFEAVLIDPGGADSEFVVIPREAALEILRSAGLRE